MKSSMQLTDEQQAAVDRFDDLRRGKARRLTLGGLAGTGKSTVIKAISDVYPDTLVCTPTGKAAHVLRSKGVEARVMHSCIYVPIVSRSGDLDFRLNNAARESVAIVDEASMLSQRLVTDFERKVRRVLYVGDYGQLEPVGDDARLMRSLDMRLTQIHRQALDSPIISFAHALREGQPPRTFGDAARVQRGGTLDLAHFDVILVGFNRTRVSVNAWVRKERGFTDPLPQVGEVVICLKNNSDYQVWNGMSGTVTAIDHAVKRISVDTSDGVREHLPYLPEQFGKPETLTQDAPADRRRSKQAPEATLWDWGYALTVHKAQGSEWPRVAVKEEIASTWSTVRWRYTAATRARDELRWVL